MQNANVSVIEMEIFTSSQNTQRNRQIITFGKRIPNLNLLAGQTSALNK